MKKFNWKEELKQSFKTYSQDMWYMLCISLAIVFVTFTQTEKQFQSVMTLIIEKDWSMIAVILIGIVFMGAGVERLLGWTIKFIGRCISYYAKWISKILLRKWI